VFNGNHFVDTRKNKTPEANLSSDFFVSEARNTGLGARASWLGRGNKFVGPGKYFNQSMAFNEKNHARISHYVFLSFVI